MSTLLDEICRHLGTADSELRWALDHASKRKVKYPEATHGVIQARATITGLKLALGTILHAQHYGAGQSGEVNFTYSPTRLAEDYLHRRRLAALERVRQQQAVEAVLADPVFASAAAEVEAAEGAAA